MKSSAFKLETALAAWRRALEVRRIFLPRDLDEQERHIRDHINHLLLEGWTEEEAFHKALAEFGSLHETEDEYRKVYLGKLRRTGQLTEEGKAQFGLLQQHLRLAFRTLRKHPLYTGINVAGFAIGIGCCLLMLLYARHMLTYDQFHEHSERIFRVMWGLQSEEYGQDARYGRASHELSADLKAIFPNHVEAFVRYEDIKATVRVEEQVFLDTLTFADSNYFWFFSFPLLHGDPETVLASREGVVLSASAAKRYFGTTDVVGQTLQITTQTPKNARHDAVILDMHVAGVAAPLPGNSSITFDLVLPLLAVDSTLQRYETTHYVRLHKPTDVDYLGASYETYAVSSSNQLLANTAQHFEYWPLQDLHYAPTFSYRGERDLPGGRSTRMYAYVLSAFSFLFLLLAASNFVMLTLGHSRQRLHEIGMRKVLGAHRIQLLRQFWTEALVLAGGAALIGIVLAILALPTFSTWVDEPLAFSVGQDVGFAIGLLGLITLSTLLAGSYPGWILTRYRPTALTLKPTLSAHNSHHTYRLIAVPFAVLALFLASMLMMRQQVNLLTTYDLGFDADDVVGIEVPEHTYLGRSRRAFPKAIESLEHVEAVGSFGSSSSIEAGYEPYWEPSDIGHGIRGHLVHISPNFLRVLGLNLIEGYPFGHRPDGMATHYPTYGLIVNEAFVRAGGWKSGLGKCAHFTTQTCGEVVGVVEDAHLQPLNIPLGPLAFRAYSESAPDQLLIRTRPGKTDEVATSIKQIWHELAPGAPIHTYRLANAAQSFHAEEQRWLHVLTTLTVLALLIAVLGLVGLVHILASQRLKELSIRKTLGAPPSQLALVLSKPILIWVVVAFALATPLAYWGAETWLASFTARIAITPAPFATAFGFGLLIVLALLGLHLRRVLRIPVTHVLHSD